VNKNKYLIDISSLNKKYTLKNNENIEIISNLHFRVKSNKKISI